MYRCNEAILKTLIIMESNIIFQNKYCKLFFKETLIVLESKKGMYNDKYFLSFEESRKYMAQLGIRI